MYNLKAKECQICFFAIRCWQEQQEQEGSSSLKPVRKNGCSLAVLNIIATKGKATANEIKDELAIRFRNKDLNIYYYLGVLKSQGVIDMDISGRQRYYSVR